MPKPLTQTTGRRKEAVARVRLRESTGEGAGKVGEEIGEGKIDEAKVGEGKSDEAKVGGGKITVNGRTLEDYFPSATHRMIIAEPLRVTGLEDKYDVDATMHGGGITGQAGALRMGIARSIIEVDPEQRGILKKAGFLTRDAREKEAKKYGLKKARKAPQYSKR